MRIAAFNVENLFDRAKALNLESTSEAKAILADFGEVSRLLEEPVYSPAVKSRILALLERLGLDRSDDADLAILRRIRGALLKRPRGGGPVEVIADGRASWIGWIELKTEQVNEIAMANTGRVIRDVNADILAVVEAEDRGGLDKFSRYVLKEIGVAAPVAYEHVMVIDGNDERGIDVGIMTKRGFTIETMRSHVDDLIDPDGPNVRENRIFSRDCPEYAVRTPGGRRLWVLPNHFKSKFGGDSSSSRNRRRAQAERVAKLYGDLRSRGEDDVIVLGDLNDVPASGPLEPLLAGTDLRDVSAHASFDTGEFAGKGTYGLGNDNNKIDYLLLSPRLFGAIKASGLFRKGAWPGRSPRRWSVYAELVEEIHAASDHHVIWADLDIA